MWLCSQIDTGSASNFIVKTCIYNENYMLLSGGKIKMADIGTLTIFARVLSWIIIGGDLLYCNLICCDFKTSLQNSC